MPYSLFRSAWRQMTFFSAVVGLTFAASILQGADRPVEQETYLTGAWFAPRNDTEREMYLKGGFTMIQYTGQCRDWAVEHGMKFIAGVNSSGMPRDVARSFEDATGTQSMSVGLFTHINFNAPSVEAWWQKRVPEIVQGMPHAEDVRFWKVHNEFGYHSGKLYDYSPGSISRYQAWLKGRYADIADLNGKWGTSFADFAAVEPPREQKEMQEQLGNWLEWRRFTCWNFADYFHTTGELVRTVLPNAAVSDNFYTTSPMQGWDNFELARRTDYMGYDIYAATRWKSLVSCLDHVRSAATAWGKPFVIIEYHAGPNNWVTEVTHRHLTVEAFLALGRECRAIQWFRWIPGKDGREQGIHGMMHDDGTPTERFTAVAEVSAFCQRLAPLLHRSRMASNIALLTSNDSVYLAYANRTGIYASRTRWDRFNAMLSAAGFQCDQIDPTVLIERDLSRYSVIVAGHIDVLPAEAVARLRRFAETGGTVVLHPDTGLLDAYGRPGLTSPYAEEGTVNDGPWQARKRLDGQGPVVVEPIGKGRFVHCAWEMPDSRTEAETLGLMAVRYRDLLASDAGLVPAWTAAGLEPTEDLDVRLLDTGTGHLLVATSLREEPVTLDITLPGFRMPAGVYLLNSETAAVEPVEAMAGENGLTLSSIHLDPTALVLIADKPWQPLIGIEAPKTFHPGQETEVAVTLDNLGAETVSGMLSLEVPEGWTVSTIGNPVFTGLRSGARAACRFGVKTPADAPVDHFAIDNPLVGKAAFSAGVTGSLTARHLPKLLPAVDLRVEYEGRELTPWQTMAPAILRWGWDNEVHIPPPPPLSISAPCHATGTLRVDPALVGKTAELSVEGIPGASVSPATVPIEHPEQTIDLTFLIPAPGAFQFTARVGDSLSTVTLQAAVHTETVQHVLEAPGPKFPLGWAPVAVCAVGVRDADASGAPVTFDFAEEALPQPSLLRVFDHSGAVVPACISPNAVALAVDVDRDSVARYVVAQGPSEAIPAAPSRVRMDPTDDSAMVITGDHYAVCFDTELGIIRWLEMDGRRVIPYRTGFVARSGEGEDYEPGADGMVEGASLAASAVEASLEFVRRQRELEIKERWSCQPGRIDIEIRVVNRGTGPLALSSLDYELGCDPDQLPRWCRTSASGAVSEGRFPSGFGPDRNAGVLDFTDEAGKGIALSLGRCAMITKWQNGFVGVRHNAALTAIGLLRDLRLDPGDTILAEFALVPHVTATVDVAKPTIIAASRRLNAGP